MSNRNTGCWRVEGKFSSCYCCKTRPCRLQQWNQVGIIFLCSLSRHRKKFSKSWRESPFLQSLVLRVCCYTHTSDERKFRQLVIHCWLIDTVSRQQLNAVSSRLANFLGNFVFFFFFLLAFGLLGQVSCKFFLSDLRIAWADKLRRDLWSWSAQNRDIHNTSAFFKQQ